MSFQYGANCYGTSLAAAQATSASQIGSIVSIGTAAYSVDVVSVSASSITYQLSNLETTATIVKEVPYTPLPCGLLDTADGLLIGWGIATAWLVTAGVLFLRRGLNE